MPKLFTTVPVPRFPSATFSLSRQVMFTPRLQKLYTPNVIETLPGDGISERAEQFARTQPMVAPTFTKINADQHAFFVPNWQLHEHFDEFITAGEDGTYQGKMPFMTVGDFSSAVDVLLSVNQFTQFTLSYSEYNEVLEKLQSILEHIDLMRAVPFILPDFLLATSSTYSTVVASNYTAFHNANSHLAGSTLRVNLMPFGAVLKVWSEFFRDENLQDDLFEDYWKGKKTVIALSQALGALTVQNILGYNFSFSGNTKDQYFGILNFFYAVFGAKNRSWKKDYFTACLPFTQKGPDVLLPLYGTFPVTFSGPGTGSTPNPMQNAGADVYFHGPNTGQNGSGVLAVNGGNPPTVSTIVNGKVVLDASGLGTTITDVRRAFRLEEMEEADARGGNRYPENTLIQFGVRTPDSRLPRSIFLGSCTSPVQVSEVVQTSETASSPQGNLAGKGISYGSSKLSNYYYTMHGFLLNFYSLRTKAVYESGIHPMFSRYDRTEWAWPRFARLGEQPVYDKELYVDGNTTEDGVFGYEPRYSEYKSEKSSVHGLLKGSLNFWTMSRRFGSQPQLNEEFITNSPRLDNFAVVNKLQPPFIVEIDYRVRANRKLPYFGVPSL